jgi:DNA repair protein RadC
MRLNRYSVCLVREEAVNGYNLDANNSSAVAELLKGWFKFETLPTEMFGILTLDTRNRIIGLHEIARGTLNTSTIHPREIFSRAILNNANSIILFHNHPSGDCKPSVEDKAITELLKNAGTLMGIQVLDHLVFGEFDYYSMNDKDGWSVRKDD